MTYNKNNMMIIKWRISFTSELNINKLVCPIDPDIVEIKEPILSVLILFNIANDIIK